MSFVKRFEREQAPIVEYAAKRPYSTKIDLIEEEFEKYAEEIIGDAPEKAEPSKIVKPPVQEMMPEEVLINNEENDESES
jgi:hypothetical protein